MRDNYISQEQLDQAVRLATTNGIINLALVERLTGISRQKLRTLQKHNFQIDYNRKITNKLTHSKIDDYVEIINSLLVQGISNSSICFDRVKEHGYKGGLTTVKNYITNHKDLIPARRIIASKTINRGRRYTTMPGEMYQMDWGFINVTDEYNNKWRAACFAMVCHHCGLRYIEFFPNAKQENLFIGMLHAFMLMGIPKIVLTDNMKSVVTKRTIDNKVIFNLQYDLFQKDVGFETRLCKVAHPFTKGKVERLVRYVKDNFVPGRTFINLHDLNKQAAQWCHDKNTKVIRETGVVPQIEHYEKESLRKIANKKTFICYLAPLRKISFDGFINYEGRKYGVSYKFHGKTVRVERSNDKLYIYNPDTFEIIDTHNVDWSKKPKYSKFQWEYYGMPEEYPSEPVKVSLQQREYNNTSFNRFSKFRFNTKELK